MTRCLKLTPKRVPIGLFIRGCHRTGNGTTKGDTLHAGIAYHRLGANPNGVRPADFGFGSGYSQSRGGGPCCQDVGLRYEDLSVYVLATLDRCRSEIPIKLSISYKPP